MTYARRLAVTTTVAAGLAAGIAASPAARIAAPTGPAHKLTMPAADRAGNGTPGDARDRAMASGPRPALAAVEAQAGAGARCRRVQLTGTIVTKPGPRPGYKGTILASEGRFKMDLVFGERGGEVRYQQNTVELTALKTYAYGGARECTNTLAPGASAAHRFSMWASLGVDAVVVEDGNQKVKSVSDQFDMLMKAQPPAAAVSFTTVCTGGQPGTVSDYGVSIPQLLQVFSRSQYSGSITLNRFGDKRQLPNVALYGGMTASAEWEVLETLVPCVSFQYQ